MRQKLHLSIILVVLLLPLAVVSCSSVSDADLINAGNLLLQYELDENYREEFNRYWRTGADWQGTLTCPPLEWHILELRIEYDDASFLWIDACDGP